MINKCVPFSSDNVLFMLPKVAKNVSLSFFNDQENLWQERFQTKILSMPQERKLCFNCKHFMSCGIKGLVMCNRSTNIWSCQEAGEKLKEQGSDFWKYGIDFAIYGLERNYWSYVDVAEHEVNLSLAVLKNFLGVCVEDNTAFGGFSFL